MKLQSARNEALAGALQKAYEQHKGELLFHGWHHIVFVARKAVEFAEELGVDKNLIEATALTHDLNYLVDTTSGPELGATLRQKYLGGAGFSGEEIARIEAIVREEFIGTRDANISDEAKALSDADSLFKVMPLNPVLFSSKFITETKTDLHEWSARIIRQQKPLLDQGIYFYTETAKRKYTAWAEVDLQLVEQVAEALEDPAIVEMLAIAHELDVI